VAIMDIMLMNVQIMKQPRKEKASSLRKEQKNFKNRGLENYRKDK
jgi:hypothetical protein